MPTTTPDGIYYADSSTAMSAEAISAAEATSVQSALRRISSSVADFTALAALSATGLVAGSSAYVAEGAVTMQWSGSAWVQVTTAKFATTAARDTAYAKASAAYRVTGATARVADYTQVYNGAGWRYEAGLVPIKPSSVTLIAGTSATLNPGGSVSVVAASDVAFEGVGLTDFSTIRMKFEGFSSVAIDLFLRNRVGGVDAATNYRHALVEVSPATGPTRLGDAAATGVRIARVAPGLCSFEVDVSGLSAVSRTTYLFRSVDGDAYSRYGGADHTTSAAYTGLRWYGAATLTGTVSFFGIPTNN